MNDQTQPGAYAITIEPLAGRVTIRRGGNVIASSARAKVMYETRLPPAVYFPPEDVLAELSAPTGLQSFCPFKGTASYRNLAPPGRALPRPAPGG